MGEILRVRKVELAQIGLRSAALDRTIADLEIALPPGLPMAMQEDEIWDFIVSGRIPRSLSPSAPLERLSIPLPMAVRLAEGGFLTIEDVLRSNRQTLVRSVVGFGDASADVLASALRDHGRFWEQDDLSQRLGRAARGAASVRADSIGLWPGRSRALQFVGVETLEDLSRMTRFQISTIAGNWRLQDDLETIEYELAKHGYTLDADPLARAERLQETLDPGSQLRWLTPLRDWQWLTLSRFSVATAGPFVAAWSDAESRERLLLRSPNLAEMRELLDELAARIAPRLRRARGPFSCGEFLAAPAFGR